MEQRLEEMRRNQKAMEAQVKEKVRRNDELKTRLLELRRGQERIAEALERVKTEKARRQTLLEEKMEKLVRTRQEIEKLRPYVLESPASLQSSLAELSESLMREKAQVDAMEKRTRALQTSIDTFNVVANDVQACVKVLEDISVELQKEEEEDARAARNKDALSERGNSVREVEQTEKLLQRQLARWNERIEALRKSSQEKQEAAQARMEELRNIQKQLREERAEKQREMERRRIRIEQTEKKVNSPLLVSHPRVPTNMLKDGRSQREHRKRDPQCARRVSEVGVPYKTLHYRDGKMYVRVVLIGLVVVGVCRSALGYPDCFLVSMESNGTVHRFHAGVQVLSRYP